MELYQRIITKKGRVQYTPYVGYTPKPDDEISNKQLVTIATSLGITCLHILETQLPEHAKSRRKIKAVEQALFELAAGHGEHLDREFVDYVISAWNTTMKLVSECKPLPPLGI